MTEQQPDPAASPAPARGLATGPTRGPATGSTPRPAAVAGRGRPELGVGVVVVTFSPGEHLAALLDSLPAAGAADAPVVLADNGSTDGSVEAAAHRPRVRLLRTGGNLGYGRAANAGAAVLDPQLPWVLVVNPDVVLEPGAVREMVAAAQRHPEVGAVGPLITTHDGAVYPSARRLPTIGAGIGHAALGWVWPGNPWTRAYRQDHAELGERPAGWLSGACLLLRRSAFDAVGGFDPGYFMYFEDVDLGRRLGLAGWTNLYCPTARARHLGGHATEAHAPRMARAHHESAYRYLAGVYPRPWQAPVRALLRVGLGLRGWAAGRSVRVGRGAALPSRAPRPDTDPGRTAP
ncbi:glycosyltransferase family 2 protein [Nakamurella leprariae]|uniref:Glycosyltransferase family 2 protein n=1 Tax=Nakamurella leprariae TaxID=2803911 RepID=A0A939C208_9ACTN|nr:glycosyltransferase family 2 protein [Nakamurella leprariae]MBM9467724.1 glycosyltransferase family 2 protein [Nakamurella leprariae]